MSDSSKSSPTEQKQKPAQTSNKRSLKKPPVGVVLLIGALIGWILHPNSEAPKDEADLASQDLASDELAGADEEPTVWTCSMHPQIQLPEFGLCPICNMDLIPLQTDSSSEGPSELSMSETAMVLAEIKTYPVQRLAVAHEVNMVGKIAYDQTQMAAIPAWFQGRIDRIFVDSTDIPVKKGDHLVALYSPDLYAAERDYLEALNTNSQLAAAAKGRLRLLGVKEEQIRQLEERGSPNENVEVYASIDGVVIHKNAMLGRYVKEGEVLYQIANLDQVWVELDAYETDLPWLRFGQEVEFDVLGWPGETFSGKISLISPILKENSRTIHVRVHVDNADGKLRPGMAVQARSLAQLSEQGNVIAADIADTWICPMHPEVQSAVPSTCTKCGMDLVPADELGFTAPEYSEDPLVIPATAPLLTGKRAVVYVRLPGDEPKFQGRQVTLGPRAGDWFVVKEGLEEGELVVFNGAFRLDAELQLTGKVSMMSPEGGDSPQHFHGDRVSAEPPKMPHEMSWSRSEASEEFRSKLGSFAKAYVGIQVGLADDDLNAAQTAAKSAQTALEQIPHGGLSGEGHDLWMPLNMTISQSLEKFLATENIVAARGFFLPLSHSLIEAVQRFGVSDSGQLKLTYCPMADNDKGADWLQFGDDVRNPYFGDEMLMCGEVITTLEEEK